jgi:hypothetical protein
MHEDAHLESDYEDRYIAEADEGYEEFEDDYTYAEADADAELARWD